MTSFIRIYRRDGQEMQKEEINHLFNIAISAYDRFGSYWVRILKKYRAEERCLDIQFGSSKRYSNPLETAEIHQDYIIWERIADEGGFPDQLYQYQWNEEGKYVHMKSFGDAIYAFDKLIYHGEDLPKSLHQYRQDQTSFDEHILQIQGTFTASNDRSFTDLYEDSEFYGPSLGYDPNYASDYFVLQGDGELRTISVPELDELMVYPQKGLKTNHRIELLYKYRKVFRLQIDELGGEEYTAAYWDNCVNPEYLQFRNDFIENK
jgi:hypothetical protein